MGRPQPHRSTPTAGDLMGNAVGGKTGLGAPPMGTSLRPTVSNITHGYAGSTYQQNSGSHAAAHDTAHLVAEAAEKVLQSNGTIATIRQQMGGHSEDLSSLRKDMEALAQVRSQTTCSY